jgi:regulator of RNase E activity RraA
MPQLLGRAVTVKAPPGDNWAVHAGLSACGEGDILVIDRRGYVEACGSGALSVILAMRRGLTGIVVDGAWRDVDDLRQIDFPIMGRGISPFSPAKQELGEINVPVCCGGVIVEPGDLVVGDVEGAVVVPHRWVERVQAALTPAPSPESGSVPDAVPDDMAQRISGNAARYWDAAQAAGGERPPS